MTTNSTDPLVRITMQLHTSTRDRLRQEAEVHGRSMSREGVRRIEASLGIKPDGIPLALAPKAKSPARRKK